MSESRIALALRRIACGRVPTSNGDANMSRHEMMEMARLTCEEIGLHYGFGLVWGPEIVRARAAAARVKKRHLRAAAGLAVGRGKARRAG